MALPRTSVTARTAAGRSPTPNPTPAPQPEPVYVSSMDTYVPIIPDRNPEVIELRFKRPNLTKIEDEPDYEEISIVLEELFRNAHAIKCTFGGRNHGHLGSVQRPAVYQTEAGQAWTIPASGGMYPTFLSGATNAEKKREVTEFINREKHIKLSDFVKDLLKNQLLKAVIEE